MGHPLANREPVSSSQARSLLYRESAVYQTLAAKEVRQRAIEATDKDFAARRDPVMRLSRRHKGFDAGTRVGT